MYNSGSNLLWIERRTLLRSDLLLDILTLLSVHYSTANDVKQTLVQGRQTLENSVSKKLTIGIGKNTETIAIVDNDI
jgi:hypothetical protein